WQRQEDRDHAPVVEPRDLRRWQPARGALRPAEDLGPVRHGRGARAGGARPMIGTSFAHFWSQGDLITRSVAALLLVMSVSAWVVIFWKGWLLRRVHVDLPRAVPALWAA